MHTAGADRWRARLEQPYLEGRCIPCELATTAGGKYASSWGKDIRGAVVFSVFGVTGEPIAAQGRAIEGSGKQTRGPLKLGAFYTPGALDADPVAICEAPIDALSFGSGGASIHCNVWMFGYPFLVELTGYQHRRGLAFPGRSTRQQTQMMQGMKLP